ncbi:hypothetical protein C3K47_12340 [Solitalea longa]|uniref:Viral A-type inclusion protein n=1 Tax=Solitalea longa TaxID=2079460 RepID=A0A2S5A137_9SPHI|nr:hypothetical protein [Solitalea longa]POY35987.1 hypothetical protein C3K47_12340 [Solitalea longa]
MKKITPFIASCVMLALVSCGSQKKKDQEQEKNLFSESMALHDEVMPKQEELFSLKNKINTLGTKMDSLKKANPALDTTQLRAHINGISAKIDTASNHMSDWMHDFTSDLDEKFQNKSHKEIMTYLKNGKEDIEKVKQEFNQSISEAKQLLNDQKIK